MAGRIAGKQRSDLFFRACPPLGFQQLAVDVRFVERAKSSAEYQFPDRK